MTTYTSNKNSCNGHVYSQHNDGIEYRESNKLGYIVLFVLVAIAVTIFSYVIPML